MNSLVSLEELWTRTWRRALNGESTIEKINTLTLILLDVEPKAYDLDVPGAAMWMLYAGEHVFESKREHIDQSEDVGGFETAEHPWWDEEERNGFCRERWDLWKSGFNEMAEMEELSEETKDLAKQAFENMDKVENAHSNENSR